MIVGTVKADTTVPHTVLVCMVELPLTTITAIMMDIAIQERAQVHVQTVITTTITTAATMETVGTTIATIIIIIAEEHAQDLNVQLTAVLR